MKCIVFVLLTFTVTLLAEARARAQFRGPAGSDAEPGKYGWIDSLEAGKAEARKTGKPLMVVLRCGP